MSGDNSFEEGKVFTSYCISIPVFNSAFFCKVGAPSGPLQLQSFFLLLYGFRIGSDRTYGWKAVRSGCYPATSCLCLCLSLPLCLYLRDVSFTESIDDSPAARGSASEDVLIRKVRCTHGTLSRNALLRPAAASSRASAKHHQISYLSDIFFKQMPENFREPVSSIFHILN